MSDRVVVLVDGSNVARCSAWRAACAAGADDVELRRRLVDAVAGWAALEDHDVVLVFDGAGPWAAGRTRVDSRTEVEGSGARSGDSVLERRAAAFARAGRRTWIASDDGEVRAVAGARAELVIRSEELVHHLKQASQVQAPPPPPTTRGTGDGTPPPARPGISGLIDDDVRAKLERIRRGTP